MPLPNYKRLSHGATPSVEEVQLSKSKSGQSKFSFKNMGLICLIS
jgi:hypothetical protein